MFVFLTCVSLAVLLHWCLILRQCTSPRLLLKNSLSLKPSEAVGGSVSHGSTNLLVSYKGENGKAKSCHNACLLFSLWICSLPFCSRHSPFESIKLTMFPSVTEDEFLSQWVLSGGGPLSVIGNALVCTTLVGQQREEEAIYGRHCEIRCKWIDGSFAKKTSLSISRFMFWQNTTEKHTMNETCCLWSGSTVWASLSLSQLVPSLDCVSPLYWSKCESRWSKWWVPTDAGVIDSRHWPSISHVGRWSMFLGSKCQLITFTPQRHKRLRERGRKERDGQTPRERDTEWTVEAEGKKRETRTGGDI